MVGTAVPSASAFRMGLNFLLKRNGCFPGGKSRNNILQDEMNDEKGLFYGPENHGTLLAEGEWACHSPF